MAMAPKVLLNVHDHDAPFSVEVLVRPETKVERAEADVTRRPIPEQLIARYINAAVRRSFSEQMEDGTWYVEVPLLAGVWAEGKTEAEAETCLRDVIEEWLFLKIKDRDEDIPVIEAIDLNVL
ncbi:MAG: type II toxin-antitoxin system HicB family antitoxin [Actinomycetota bacterium]|nr:type II toxin-antitoxin system HicB family antitoxin [Actinomycetota bacterium]